MRHRYVLALAVVSVLGSSVSSGWLLAGPSMAAGSIRAKAAKNTTFAGYRANGGGGFASFNVKATFVVPKLRRCTAASQAIAPDVDVGNGKTGSGVGLFVGCYKGRPDYFPFILLNGSNTDYAAGTVQAGDHVALHLSEGPKSADLTFQDLTHKLVKVKKGSGLKGLGFPGIGDNSWNIKGVELGVPDFGTISFSHCTVNGAALGSGGSPSAPAALEYDRASKAGTLQIATGVLTAGKQAFTTYFKHS